MGNRNLRVGELLKREISNVMHTRYQGETVAFTVTGVDVSPDHQNAKVFYTVIDRDRDEPDAIEFFRKFGGRIRHELTKIIVLKRMPALEFMYDISVERGDHITELIDSLKFSDQEEES